MTKLMQGDCLERMKEIESGSVDTIITDPPYGLKFMGKKWDYDVPSVDVWKECLRVLKPGGTALIFAGSRTQHRMAVNVEDAGFILKDTLMWLYGSGFPKATDISKQIDKKFGAERTVVSSYSRDGRSGGILGKEVKIIKHITTPATPEAKRWNGWKSHGLKPAYEPILLCIKPNEGTYAQNALKWGVAGLNIDGSRIPHNEPIKKMKAQSGGSKVYKQAGRYKETTDLKPKGRFPANILLSCDCDYVLKPNISKEDKKKLMEWLYENA